MSYIVAMATEASEKAHSNITVATETLNYEAEKLAKDRNKLEGEKEQWEENKKMLEQKSAFGPNVTLDVGGTRYKVSRATLTRNFPRSHMLSCMFSGLYPPDEKEEGAYSSLTAMARCLSAFWSTSALAQQPSCH